MKLSIQKKITLGFGVCCVLIIVCGTAGYKGTQRMSEIIGFITNEVWRTADGAMDGSSAIETQIIAADNIRRDNDIEANQAKLAAAREHASEAFDDVRSVGLISKERLAQLDQKLTHYNNQLDQWLETNTAYKGIHKQFGQHSQAFVIFSNMITAMGDSTMGQIQANPDEAVSWSGGLETKWSASHGAQQSLNGLMQQLYFIERMETGTCFEECEAQMQMALMIQEDAAERMLATGAFELPMEGEDEDATYASHYRKLLQTQKDLIAEYVNRYKAFKKINQQYNQKTADLLAFLETIDQEAKEQVSEQMASVTGIHDQVKIMLLSAVLGCLALSTFGGIWIVRSIVGPLKNAINTLRAVGAEVANESGKVSYSTQELSSGSSNQATSLEETGSALDEMTGMTKQNAEYAQSVKSTAHAARTTAENGLQRSMEMERTMQDVKRTVGDMKNAVEAMQASETEVSKIVSTIDEIAFQTNILALNAAVEAARAGESGMGFAVVADEVRNLAQRSAEAARETSQKIELSLSSSSQGIESSSRVAESLQEIDSRSTEVASCFNQLLEQVRDVDQKVSSITTSSQEQHQGIDKINIGVTEINRVTQQNAATAQETANACNHLQTQSQRLKTTVNELFMVLQGHSNLTFEQKQPSSSDDKSSRPDYTHNSDHVRVQRNVYTQVSKKPCHATEPVFETASAQSSYQNGASHTADPGDDSFRDF